MVSRNFATQLETTEVGTTQVDALVKDIQKYCKVAHPNQDEPNSGIEYEGKIILCLKMQYTNKSQSLQLDCRKRVLEIIIEANTNMKLDPTLRRHCKSDMNNLCKTELSNDFEDTVNSVHNCLKHKFLRDELRSEKCKNEVARLLKEGKADVHVDGELFDACENAIMRLCRTESFGNGRKMSCLLSLVEDPKALTMINSRCVLMIKDRREMWAKAGNYESQSLVELYGHVVQSSTRVYLLSMLGLIVAALILLGICCGRVTKRVAVDLKNK